MAKRHKRRLFAGAVCTQIVYTVAEGTDRKKSLPRKPRFQSQDERDEFNRKISEARMAALVNANFGPESLYSTLTFDIDYDVHTAAECRRERDNFYRRLIRRYPEAKLLIVYGQGKSTSRFHLHMISDGIPADEIAKIWGRGSVAESKHLRKHNFYLDENGNKVDHGQDYTALSNYLHRHWRKEFGGHRYKASRTCVRPEPEPATEAVRDYSPERPPVAPRGYILVESRATRYGFLYFKHVYDPKPERDRHRLN